MTTHEVIAFLLGAVAMSLLRALFSGPRGVDAATMARVERKLDQLLGQSGLSDQVPPMQTLQTLGPAASSSDVMQLIRQGKKIEAIKLYREQTGVGLKDAKDAVEDIERRSR